MYIDARNELCDATALNTGAAGTYLIGNQPNLTTVTRDIGNGQPLYLIITVDTGITTAGSAGTLAFSLASDDSASVSTTTSTVHFTTPALVTGSTAIAAGTVYCYPLPNGTYEQYLGLLQITGTTAVNAGKINAFITTDPTKWIATPDGL